MSKTEQTKGFRTYQLFIKKGHRLHKYMEGMTQNAKNMYNTTNFYIRQVYTAVNKEGVLQPLQQEVMDNIQHNLPALNEHQLAIFEKKKKRYLLQCQEAVEKGKKLSKEPTLNLFDMPTNEKSFVKYNLLDALFKMMKQDDYKSLPAQSSQAMMKQAFQDWENFFASLRAYKQNPSSFTGRPRIPGYKKASKHQVYFTNQDCVIKGKQLKFPLTKEKLSIGKLSKVDGKLKEVRVNPYQEDYVVELVFQVEEKPVSEQKERLMSIDLGVNNFATIVCNTGHQPVLYKGGVLKSINQYYNKQRAHFFGVLRQGKNPKEGNFLSKRLQNLDRYRFLRIKDIFHKMSFDIVSLAEQENIDTIVIGKNDGWKQDVEMRKKDKQHFIGLPFQMFLNMMVYKAKAAGIDVKFQEESYTSQASFLDDDDIPVYGKTKEKPSFQGKRVKRGLYRSKGGLFLNADINGACNILRKAYKEAFQNIMHASFVKLLQQPMVKTIN